MYNEAYKQAFSIGEFLTFPVGSFDASGFKGAALVSNHPLPLPPHSLPRLSDILG